MKNTIKRIINKKFILFTIAIVLFFIVLILDFNYKNSYIDVNAIASNELEEIVKTREKYDDIIELYYDNSVIPYNTEANYYLFYKTDDLDYKNIYCKYDFFIKLIGVDNNKIDIIIYNDDYYKITEIKFTNIPVISMNTKNVQDDKSYGEMYLYSSNTKLNKTDILHYNCEFHIRGASSRNSDKKSYRLNILSNKNKNISVSMLGMDSDSDWILNSCCFDDSYIREKIGYDIWNTVSNQYKHSMEYIELIIDNVYQGIYCLQEVVDLDTFSADKKNDFFISIKRYEAEIPNHILFNNIEENSNEFKQIDEFEFEKGLENNYMLKIDILRAFVNKIHNQVENNINIEYNMQNNGDYLLFINLVLAIDNGYKNQKILFRDMGNYYLIEKTPWDLDFSMTNTKLNTLFNTYSDIGMILCDDTIPISYFDVEEFNKYQKEQYFKLRKTIYNEETLNNMIDSYMSYLQECGAVQRNAEKWNNNDFENECNNIKNFFKERIAILDEYYGGL